MEIRFKKSVNQFASELINAYVEVCLSREKIFFLGRLRTSLGIKASPKIRSRGRPGLQEYANHPATNF